MPIKQAAGKQSRHVGILRPLKNNGITRNEDGELVGASYQGVIDQLALLKARDGRYSRVNSQPVAPRAGLELCSIAKVSRTLRVKRRRGRE